MRIAFFIIKLSIILVPFIFFVRYITKKHNDEDRLIISTWRYTVGKVVNTSSRKSGQFAKLRFTVDGKTYTEEFSFRDAVIGNCYNVHYDSINPEYMSVLDMGAQRRNYLGKNIEVPVYDVEIDSDTTRMGLHFIEYKYNFGNKTYYGNKHLKHRYYFKYSKENLKAIIDSLHPRSSYLIWPTEPERLYANLSGVLYLY